MFTFKAYVNRHNPQLVMEDYNEDISIYQIGDAPIAWFKDKIKWTESELNGQWDFALLTSDDGIDAIKVSRDFISRKIQTEYPDSFTPFAIFFSANPFEHMDSIFEGKICISETVANIWDLMDYNFPFSHEHFRAMTYQFLSLSFADYVDSREFKNLKEITTVCHADEEGMLLAKISGAFPIILNLESFDEAKRFQQDMYCLRALKQIQSTVHHHSAFIDNSFVTNCEIDKMLDEINDKLQVKTDEMRRQYFCALPF